MLLTFVLMLCFIILCFVPVKSKICSVRWNTISFFSIQISFCSWYEHNTCWLGNNTHVGIRLNSIYLIGGALETSSSDDMFAAILNLIWWQKLLLSLHEKKFGDGHCKPKAMSCFAPLFAAAVFNAKFPVIFTQRIWRRQCERTPFWCKIDNLQNCFPLFVKNEPFPWPIL